MEFLILLRKEEGWGKRRGREFNFPLGWKNKVSMFEHQVQLSNSKYNSAGTKRCLFLSL